MRPKLGQENTEPKRKHFSKLRSLRNAWSSPQIDAATVSSNSGTVTPSAPLEEQPRAVTDSLEAVAGPSLGSQPQDVEKPDIARARPRAEPSTLKEGDELLHALDKDAIDVIQNADSTRHETLRGCLTAETAEGSGVCPGQAIQSLWDRAIASIRCQDPKLVDALMDKLTLIPDGKLVDTIEQALEKRYDKIRGSDGAADSMARKWFRRTLKFISSTKFVAMPIAALDPHKIAPAALGGFYFLVGLLEGATDDGLAAIKVTMEIAGTVARWNCIENQQILTYQDKSLRGLYQKLGDQIVVMYEDIIRLLGTLLAWFDNGWRHALSIAMPQSSEWKSLNELIKSHEANCNSTRDQISMGKESSKETSSILTWICPAKTYDIRAIYRGVQTRTKIETKYQSRCQWILQTDEFDAFHSPGKGSVLWLQGTIGTGKTTLMARAIEFVDHSPLRQANADLFAMFFFDKRSSKGSDRSVETCMRSILRQLSWNSASLEIEPPLKDKYNQIKDSINSDSELEIGECIELMKELLTRREAYIMIDGIDECNEPAGLMRELKMVWNHVQDHSTGRGILHLMLSGRMDGPVVSRYLECSQIATNHAVSTADQEYFINTEINEKRKEITYSEFFTTDKGYPTRLRDVLKLRAHGVFRWIEFQIQVITEYEFEDQIERALQRLENGNATSIPDLNFEYGRLLDLRREDQIRYPLLLKLLRFIACCSWPLSAASLAEAMNLTQIGQNAVHMTERDVRKLLAGFVYEEPVSRISVHKMGPREYKHTKSVLELAHASVVEYLTTTEEISDSFTSSQQNLEALGICFACIGQPEAQELEEEPVPGEQREERDMVYWRYREKLSDLLYYSCREWANHCKLALAEDSSNATLDCARDFICSPSYALWNRIIRYLETHQARIWEQGFVRTEYVWHDTSSHFPGFVIVVYDLIPLLDVPDIQKTINLNSVNGKGQTLLDTSLICSTHATFERLMSCSEVVEWDGAWVSIYIAMTRKWPDAVEKLLNSRTDLGREDSGRKQTRHTESITEVLQDTLGVISSTVTNNQKDKFSDLEPLSQICKQLLVHGADIWATHNWGEGIMHKATVSTAQRIVLEHAPDLKNGGDRGSIQRLLRMKDMDGQTPLDVCDEDSRFYLEEQLSQAIARDGGPLRFNRKLQRYETLMSDAESEVESDVASTCS